VDVSKRLVQMEDPRLQHLPPAERQQLLRQRRGALRRF
jgi:hypothetical protein